MTSVSTVSCGTSGTYESYDSLDQSYDTNQTLEAPSAMKSSESPESYEGTGVYQNRCPRDAPVCVRANLARRARWRALCGRGHARRRREVGR